MHSYALHVKGTDFFVPRGHPKAAVSNASADATAPADEAQAVGSESGSGSGESGGIGDDHLPASWLRTFCAAVAAYEQRVAGFEGGSLLTQMDDGHTTALKITVTHASHWSELQSYQGYAAQCIWELQVGELS